MDVSSEYVKMCRAAKEIQDLWTPKLGDYCIDMGDTWIIGNDDTRKYVTWAKSHDTWLPRQDQLQDMMFTTKDITAMHIIAWLNSGGIKYNSLSMEQTTLKMVMYTKHGKEWNRSEWV